MGIKGMVDMVFSNRIDKYTTRAVSFGEKYNIPYKSIWRQLDDFPVVPFIMSDVSYEFHENPLIYIFIMLLISQPPSQNLLFASH